MKQKYDKPVVIGIATFGTDRREALAKVIEVLTPQCDLIVVYDNVVEPDITDLGKFAPLLFPNGGPFYFFSCDDDLIYPDTYVEDMIAKIKEHGTIVTHHGRVLNGLDRSYYWGHTSFRCLADVYQDQIIDVAGTGVTAFDTEYFHPTELTSAKDMKMSDLVFSLEAAKQGKKITVLAHKAGYIKHHDIDLTKTIAATESRGVNKGLRQQWYANEIIKLNASKNSYKLW